MSREETVTSSELLIDLVKETSSLKAKLEDMSARINDINSKLDSKANAHAELAEKVAGLEQQVKENSDFRKWFYTSVAFQVVQAVAIICLGVNSL